MEYMKSLKRIISIIILAAFCFNIMAMFKPNEVYAAESRVISFGNGFIELKVNKGNGGYYIKTLEGTKLRKSDKNKNLLFPSSEFDTSFSSFRIDGKDYIFGRSYGFLNMGGEFLQAPALNENTISSTWRIGDVEITQRLEMITNTASQYLGNVIIEYNVTNKSNKAKEIGTRIMLDTMLGENDGAQFEYGAAKNGQYTHVGDRISSEKEYAGGDVPTIWKTYDSFESPLVAAYGYNGSYIGSNVAAPDKVIMAHWNNLAASMYDYSADPDMTFSDFNNKYETPDSAIAMYWDEKSLGPNESISYKTMYGVMVNITGSEDADFGINLLAPRSLKLTDSMLAYEDDGDFQISVEIDNTIVANRPVSGITLQLTLEKGLSLKDPENTATEIYLENIEAGGTRRFTWDVVGAVQNTACIKGFSVNANKNNAIIATARRYILLPGTYNQKPDITITKVTPNRLYAPGEKYITVKGTNFSNLVDKQRWAMFLVDSEKKRYEIPMEDVSVNAEKNTITAIVRDTSFKVGFYTVEFDFDNEITKLEGFDDSKGKRLTVSAKEIFLSDDPKDDNIRSGAIAFVRDPDNPDTNIHKIKTFSDPEEFDDWREYIADMEQQRDKTLLLLFIKGKITQNREDAQKGKINYSIDTTDEPAIINNTIKYTGEPMSITGDESKNSGNNGTISIAFDGELMNVGGGSFYKGKCKINVEDGTEYSLDVDREDDDGTETLKLEISPVVSALQSICGYVIEIKYGEFKRRLKDTNGDTLDKPLYAIGYGGMLSLNFLDPGGDDKKSGDSSWDDEDPDKVTLKAEIDNLLYGEYADGNAGFIGLKCEVEIKFPSFLGSLTNDKFAGGLLSVDTIQREYGVEGELSNLGPIPSLEFGLTIIILLQNTCFHFPQHQLLLFQYPGKPC
jgi:predicted heme/steroid binding protein